MGWWQSGSFRPIASAFALAAVFMSAAMPVHAADWIFTPAATLTATATDNVNGSPEGFEQSDLIISPTASLGVLGQGARVQLNLNYAISRDQFVKTDNDDFRQNLLGFGRVELLEDQIFVESEASLSLAAINDEGTITSTDRVQQENQTQVTNFRISPVFRHHFGSWADSESRYRFSRAAFSQDSNQGGLQATPSNSVTHSLTQNVTSGPNFGRLLWSFNSLTELTERADEDEPFKRSRAALSTEYVITRQISLLNSLGYEQIEDPSLDGQETPDGAFWTVGGRWRPGPRTDISAEFGHRFGDRFWNGAASYRIAEGTTFLVSYDESVETNQTALNDRLSFVGADAFGNIIDIRTGLPINPNDPAFDLSDQDEVFLRRALNMSLAGASGRASYSLVAFYSEREGQPSGQVEASMGGTATFGWQLTRLTDISLQSSYRSLSEDLGDEQQTVNVRLALNYTLTDSVSGSTSYTHLRRMSDDPLDQLQENAISFSLRKAF